MKKKMLLVIWLAMASVITITTMSACSDNDDEATKPSGSLKDTPIKLNILLADVQTRAGYQSAESLQKFYLKIDQAGDKYDYNVVMKKEESSWKAYASEEATTPVQMLWEGSNNVVVTAATSALSSSSYNVVVSDDQMTEAAIVANDHLYYYNGNVMPSNYGITVELGHLMSKVEIKLTLGNEYEGETDPISSVAVFGTASSATYDPSNTPTWSNYNTAADIRAYNSEAYNKTNRTATYEAILVPQTVAANNFGVTIQIGDKDYLWTSAAEVSLESGCKYTLELTVGGDKVSSASFSASAWGTGGTISSTTE